MTSKAYRERHIYQFTCSGCSKQRRTSFKRSRAKRKLCRKCRLGHYVNPNQLALGVFLDGPNAGQLAVLEGEGDGARLVPMKAKMV